MIRRLKDREISAAIMHLRIAAGGSAEICPTCCCPRETPYRFRINVTQIVEGCVDASHTEDMLEREETNADRIWHEREEAAALREKDLVRLKKLEADLETWRLR